MTTIKVVLFAGQMYAFCGLDKEVEFATRGLKTLFERYGETCDINRPWPELRPCKKVYMLVDKFSGSEAYELMKQDPQ